MEHFGGEKDLDFAQAFKALGVEIRLSKWTSGMIEFANTQKRVDELVEFITSVLSSKKLNQSAAMSLRGRMQFARAQLWGRSGKICLDLISKHAYESQSPELEPQALEALSTFVQCLRTNRPRVIQSKWQDQFLIFTDASFEPTNVDRTAGLGGLLFNSAGHPLVYFSFVLSTSDLEKLGYPPKKTVILEAEMLAMLIAIDIWGPILFGCPVIIFVDNNSARDICISGSARSFPATRLISELLVLEDHHNISPWYTRVPSRSNPADLPSRVDSHCENLGSRIATGVVSSSVEWALSRLTVRISDNSGG